MADNWLLDVFVVLNLAISQFTCTVPKRNGIDARCHCSQAARQRIPGTADLQTTLHICTSNLHKNGDLLTFQWLAIIESNNLEQLPNSALEGHLRVHIGWFFFPHFWRDGCIVCRFWKPHLGVQAALIFEQLVDGRQKRGALWRRGDWNKFACRKYVKEPHETLIGLLLFSLSLYLFLSLTLLHMSWRRRMISNPFREQCANKTVLKTRGLCLLLLLCQESHLRKNTCLSPATERRGLYRVFYQRGRQAILGGSTFWHCPQDKPVCPWRI